MPGGWQIGDRPVDKQLGDGHYRAPGKGMDGESRSRALDKQRDDREKENERDNQDAGQRKIGAIPGKAGDAGFLILRQVPVAQYDGGNEYGQILQVFDQ